jgi:hypothetical protein
MRQATGLEMMRCRWCFMQIEVFEGFCFGLVRFGVELKDTWREMETSKQLWIPLSSCR